jgi:hypothetical protein
MGFDALNTHLMLESFLAGIPSGMELAGGVFLVSGGKAAAPRLVSGSLSAQGFDRVKGVGEP